MLLINRILVVVGIITTCHTSSITYNTPGSHASVLDVEGCLCLFLSFLTNVIVTSIIAYQTWYVTTPDCHARPICLSSSSSPCYRIHWRLVRKVLGGRFGKSQVLKILILLIESGTAYCTLWVCPMSSLIADGNKYRRTMP